jgi:Flp pilus assembly protein TadB
MRHLSSCIGATLAIVGLAWLTLLGLAAVVIPAALAILAIELGRAKRYLRGGAGFAPGRNSALREAARESS